MQIHVTPAIGLWDIYPQGYDSITNFLSYANCGEREEESCERQY